MNDIYSDSNLSQSVRRQSAPKPSISAAAAAVTASGMSADMDDMPSGDVSRIEQPIGTAQIQKAQQVLEDYKRGKANLEKRVIADEQWYKLQHWKEFDGGEKEDKLMPRTAWLFNCIANKHASAMDNFPRANVLAREQGDEPEAKKLSQIIPVIMDMDDFEATYSAENDDKMRYGTGIYGVFWDSTKHGGLGDITVSAVDVLSIFWEPGVTDIQASRNIFVVKLEDNEYLEERYPELADKLSSATMTVAQYEFDDAVDTTNKSAVVDWYYKRVNKNGQTVLHYCKYVGDTVLFASENDASMQESGFYNHGMYPFVFDPLFPVKGTPCGYGYIDIGKDTQEYIDRGNRAVMKSMIANASPRTLASVDSPVNEDEYRDVDCDIVHVAGAITDNTIKPLPQNDMPSIYLNVLTEKINELKETTGNRDVNNGGTTSGATAASAIAAMQEAASRLDRDSNKGAYRAFRKVVLIIIELIRQFYSIERTFRIIGERGAAEYTMYSNENIQPQAQGVIGNEDFGYRIPMFDLSITAEKASPYSRLSQNELALQFYGAGFFAPQNYQQSLACLDMMDFDGKSELMQKILANGMNYMMAMQAAVMTSAEPQGKPEAQDKEALGGDSSGEDSRVKKTRENVANSTSPV